MDEVASLLARVNAGEAGALEALFAACYGELRRLARSRLREGGRSTLLDTGALVHDSYLRMIGSGALRPEHRGAFFAYASATMRSVIVDAVRERQALRRGGDLQRLTLDTTLGDELPAPGEEQLLQIHDALQTLAQAEPRLAQVVEMRFFGGYEETEIAAALGLTDRTVRRDWDKAQRLLSAMLAE